MNVYEYVFKGKVACWIPFIMVIICCVIRLNVPLEVIGSTFNYLSMFIYAYFPLAIWFYIQRIHNYYSSGFVHIRQGGNKNIFLWQTYINYLTIILFSLFLTIIQALIMLSSNMPLIEYFMLFLKSCATYSLLITIFHIFYLYKKDIKIAFAASYCTLLLVYLSDSLFLLNMKVGELKFSLYYIMSCIFISIIAEGFILIFTKKIQDTYAIYMKK